MIPLNVPRVLQKSNNTDHSLLAWQYSRMPAEIEASGTRLDVENAQVAPRRVKVHSRCAKDPQKLKSTLENLYRGGFTIEMRHNMYIINSVEFMDQEKIVSVLTWTCGFRDNPFTDKC